MCVYIVREMERFKKQVPCNAPCRHSKLIIDANFDKNKGYYKIKQVRRTIKGKTIKEEIIKGKHRLNSWKKI